MTRRTRPVPALLIAIAATGWTLAGCGSDAADSGTAEPSATTAAAADTGVEPTATTEATSSVSETTTPDSAADVDGASSDITEFAFGAGDFYFDTRGVTELPAGLVQATMEVDPTATEAHVAMFARLKDGETTASVLEAAATDFTGYQAAQKVDFVGGINALPAGGTQSSIVELTPGTYVLACFIPAQDGSFPPKPHSALGMWSEIEVVEEEAPAAEVAAEGTIVMNEMSFELPADFDGVGTFAVENQGELLHEMGIVELKDGKTGDDVAAFYDFSQGPPQIGNEPDTPSGGFAANHPGQDGYVELDLGPGNYVLVCFVGNEPPAFSTHLNEGMWKEFTVGSP